MKSTNIIILLAGLVGAPMCKKNPHEAQLINLDGQIYLFNKISNSQNILMPTTNSAYGTSDGKICNEDLELNPISTYGKHKVKVENELVQKNRWMEVKNVLKLYCRI